MKTILSKITGPLAFLSCIILVAFLAAPVKSASAQASADPELVRKLDDTNKQLARIASALEIIAGTGNQSWKPPK